MVNKIFKCQVSKIYTLKQQCPNCNKNTLTARPPKYRVEVTSTDYKTAENILKNTVDKIIKEITKLGGTGEFQKDG